MNKLNAQYRLVAIVLFTVLTAALGIIQKRLLVPDTLASRPSQDWPAWITAILVSVSTYVLFFRGGLAIYDHYLWKLFNPRLNCSGRWNFVVRRSRSPKIHHKGTALIEQTARAIKIYGESSSSVLWQVRSASFNERMEGFIAYTGVSAKGSTGLLDGFCGVGRFGPKYLKGKINARPRQLLFICQEMEIGIAQYATWEITYLKLKDSSVLRQIRTLTRRRYRKCLHWIARSIRELRRTTFQQWMSSLRGHAAKTHKSEASDSDQRPDDEGSAR